MYDNRKSCKKYYSKNREKILEKRREYYSNNKQKVLDYSRKYYQKNKSKKIQYRQEYYKNNKDKILNAKKQYRQRNIDNILRLNDLRKRRLKRIKVLNNFFPMEVKINWHHVNDMFVVPIPYETHKKTFVSDREEHRERANLWMYYLYGIDFKRLLSD